MNLYLKHRPKKLNQVVGNEEIVDYLEQVLKKPKDAPHVLLFYGPSGCGKTTLARIVSNELGVTESNFIEINSANFRGIDTVRELVRTSRYFGIGGGVRVWLIDEVHKMTNDAQNAILKLLEDTPDNSYYILCTTEPEKLLKTVRGRCIQLQVKPLDDNQMEDLLKDIVLREGKKLKGPIYVQIIQDSFGQARNALQILDRVLQVPKDQQLAMAEQSAAEFSESIELCRTLLKGGGWKQVRTILVGLKNQDPEGIRRHVLGYAQSVLLKQENDKAAQILEEFLEPFYNTGFPGLVYACYSISK